MKRDDQGNWSSEARLPFRISNNVLDMVVDAQGKIHVLTKSGGLVYRVYGDSSTVAELEESIPLL